MKANSRIDALCIFFLGVVSLCFLNACQEKTTQKEDILSLSWEEITTKARGTRVNLMMWQGDPLINAYIKQFVTPQLKDQYNIDLNISAGQGSTITTLMENEIQAGVGASQIDLMWINGETFYQLKSLQALFGPFIEKLPNSQYIDWSNPFINQDFQQPIEGYECPWGNVQMALIYDTLRTPHPPRNMPELEKFVRERPGKFSIGTEFTGMTFLKSLLNEIAGDPKVLTGPFNEAVYKEHSEKLWLYLNRIKPYFWKQGKTFPESVSTMHQLFANGELDITMSNNDSEVDNKILQEIFPNTSRAYVWEKGTIQNSHYMGIAHNSANPAGAMVVVNFLISPEAQYEKLKPAVWGDGTVLNQDKLPDIWRERFSKVPDRIYAPQRSAIEAKAIQEPAPEYMIRLYNDFRTEVIER